MTNEEKIQKIRTMEQAYTLYSVATRMPYVECEPVDFNDIAYIFESKEEAENIAEQITNMGNPVNAVELKTIEIPISADEKNNIPEGKMYRNQLREHLMKFPTIGLNAVCFKTQGEEGVVLTLEEVIPPEVWQKVEKEIDELSGVKLTGVYYAQYLHRKDRDMNVLRDLSEEFYNNLANAQLYLPVVPDADKLNDENLDIRECDLPCIVVKTGDGNDSLNLLALFTSIDELGAYCRQNPAKARIARVAFEGVYNLINSPMSGCVIDPMSLNIPVRKEDIPKLVEASKNRVLS